MKKVYSLLLVVFLLLVSLSLVEELMKEVRSVTGRPGWNPGSGSQYTRRPVRPDHYYTRAAYSRMARMDGGAEAKDGDVC